MALAAVAASTLVSAAQAQEPVATVTAVDGGVTAGPDANDRRPLEAGSPIFERESITSGETGNAAIEFRDGVRLAIGTATDLDVRLYLLRAGQPNSSVFDVYEGAARFDLRGAPQHRLGIQSSTAVIDGRAALFTVIAEEWNTVVWVQSGRVRVQTFEPGRDTVGRVQEVRAQQLVRITAYQPAPPPREISDAERDAIARRLGTPPG